MTWTKIKYDKKQRAIAQKIRNEAYKFLCIALLLNEIYHFYKIKEYSFYTLLEKAWTKRKYEN
jgi:hypothetical protein